MCKDICKEERKEERERGPKGKGEGYKDTGGRSNVSEVEYLLLIQPFLEFVLEKLVSYSILVISF